MAVMWFCRMMVSQRDERNGDGGFTAIANWRCIAPVCLITRRVLRRMTALPDALCFSSHTSGYTPETGLCPVARMWWRGIDLVLQELVNK
jgi:hypothetical protein